MKQLIKAGVFLFWALAANVTVAETLVINDQVVVRESSIERPARGSTQAAVEVRFGTPVSRHPTVGQPPITRWDYQNFSVFFEGNRVIHSVAAPAS